MSLEKKNSIISIINKRYYKAIKFIFWYFFIELKKVLLLLKKKTATKNKEAATKITTINMTIKLEV